MKPPHIHSLLSHHHKPSSHLDTNFQSIRLVRKMAISMSRLAGSLSHCCQYHKWHLNHGSRPVTGKSMVKLPGSGNFMNATTHPCLWNQTHSRYLQQPLETNKRRNYSSISSSTHDSLENPQTSDTAVDNAPEKLTQQQEKASGVTSFTPTSTARNLHAFLHESLFAVKNNTSPSTVTRNNQSPRLKSLLLQYQQTHGNLPHLSHAEKQDIASLVGISRVHLTNLLSRCRRVMRYNAKKPLTVHQRRLMQEHFVIGMQQREEASPSDTHPTEQRNLWDENELRSIAKVTGLSRHRIRKYLSNQIAKRNQHLVKKEIETMWRNEMHNNKHDATAIRSIISHADNISKLSSQFGIGEARLRGIVQHHSRKLQLCHKLRTVLLEKSFTNIVQKPKLSANDIISIQEAVPEAKSPLIRRMHREMYSNGKSRGSEPTPSQKLSLKQKITIEKYLLQNGINDIQVLEEDPSHLPELRKQTGISGNQILKYVTQLLSL